MPLPLTALNPDYSRRRKKRRFAVTASGSYPTGGDPVDFSTILNPGFIGDTNPSNVPTFEQLSAEVPGGYTYQFVPGTGTTLALAWKLKLFSAAGTELTAAAYPAGLTGAGTILINVDQPAWAN